MNRLAAVLLAALLAACDSQEPAFCGTGGSGGTGGTGTGGSKACSVDAPAWGLGGEQMFPGSDCGSCHRSGGKASDSVLSVAGSVFRTSTCPEPVASAKVHVTDALGAVAELLTNDVGNFFSMDYLVPPMTVSVEVGGVESKMTNTTPTGSCGSCHGFQGSGVGWLY